ncbi:MAG: APC family permease [Ruminococcaceae bacterium]|nr:APC family permease [Oscillospiraceae bacterium]
MENKLEKKYGLFTAICMVVGTVIGSGVFFKAQVILQKTEGNMPMGILAWLIGGAIMICCILAFAAMAQKYEKVNGIVDYAEALVGERYGYYIGWFMTTIYYPTLTSILAWVSARYTMVFLTSCWPDIPLLIPAAEGGAVVGPECIALTLFYFCMSYAINALSPILAGKFQTSTTIIKFIPLTLMAVVGIIAGLFSPNKLLVSNFAAATVTGGMGAPLLASVCATAFAYEGWIISTSINSELKDAKRNLPKALIVGGIIIVATYTLYYLGVAGGATVDVLMADGATVAFTNVFGGVVGNILNLFIVISCLGTTNGLMLGCCRGMYALAARGRGPKPELFSQVDKASNLPTNSAIIGLLFGAAWILYFYVSNLAGLWNGWTMFTGTPNEHVIMVFDPSELPILTTYAMYLPIFIQWMRKADDQSTVRRYVIPALAIAGSCFMVYASIVGHRWGNLWYLVVFAVIMFIGSRFEKRKV